MTFFIFFPGFPSRAFAVYYLLPSKMLKSDLGLAYNLLIMWFLKNFFKIDRV